VQVDLVGGRYLYSLARDFEALGCLVCFRNNYRFLATMRIKMAKRLLLNRPFRVYESISELPSEMIAVELTDREDVVSDGTHRRVRILYDKRWPESSGELPMTFFVHFAMHDRLLAAPPPNLEQQRPWRVFFAGRAVGRIYNTDILPREFGKMSRGQILHTLEASLPADRILRIESKSGLADTEMRSAFVWAVSEKFKIAQAEWLQVLGKVDFFLACPGTEMPLCHNLVESLSQGVVPILEHPEFLDPPLQHGVNCLVFHGRDELIATLNKAFELDANEIKRLRAGAYAYYREHLAPGSFARRLIAASQSGIDLLWDAYRARRNE
jgi:hypothetical protein